MSQTVEVAVVGTGMFGSAAARYLSEAGAEVLMIGPAEPTPADPPSRHTFGAYYDEARITRRLGWDEVWGTLDASSQGRFAALEEKSGMRFFHDHGSLVLMAGSIAHRTDAILRQSAAEDIAVERCSEADLRREFPLLGLPPMAGGVEGLLEREQAGYLDPRGLVTAQLALAEARGARLLRGAVTHLAKDASGLWDLRVDRPECCERVRAKRVLVATGAFTNHNGVLPAGRALAMHAFTEPNLLLEVADEQLAPLRRLPPVVTVDPADSGNANMSVYLLPPIRYPDGRWYVRLGPGMQPIVEELRDVGEMVAWYTEQRITAAQEEFLRSMAGLLLPSLRPASVRTACCIIEKTPSRYPYVGPVDEDDSLTVAVGGNGHGARGSDEIGRLASTVVMGMPWDSPLPADIFRPLLSDAGSGSDDGPDGRPEFLRPPFGLC